jgi:tripartite-type tricarboxylate transporter receptor subunit TctC
VRRIETKEEDMSLSRISRRCYLAGVAAVAVAAGALSIASPAFAQAKMEPLADGFPSRPIVLLVVDEPGSTDSVFASQIAEAASKYSPQPVVVEHRIDFTNFGTWEALAWVQDQGELASEGYITYIYTLPDATIDLLAIDIESQVGVGLDDLVGIIGAEKVPLIMIQRSDAPWGNTLEDLVKYAKEHPGEVRHISGGPGSGHDATMQAWVRNLGIEVKDIQAGSPAERALAVASGEGDINTSPVDVFSPHMDAGRVVPLMASGKDLPPPWDKLPSAQGTLGWTDDPFGQVRVIAATPEVSDEHRQWLFDLFAQATKDEDYQKKRLQISGLQILNLNTEELRAIADTAIEKVKPIYQEKGIYWGDKK